MIDVEAGVGLNIWFGQFFGIYFELPIDLVFGEEVALNIDATAGFGIGF